MKFKWNKKNIFFICVLLLTSIFSIQLGRLIEKKKTYSENVYLCYNDFFKYLSRLQHDLDLTLFTDDEIYYNGVESVKSSLHKLVGLLSMDYQWCLDIFVGDDYVNNVHSNGRLRDFFYDLNSFMNNQDGDTQLPNYTQWYYADGIISDDEIEYLNNKINIINEMYNNCNELYSSRFEITVEEFRDAVLEPIS